MPHSYPTSRNFHLDRVKLTVPLLMAGIVADLVERAAVADAFDNGAIEVIGVQEHAAARLLGHLGQTLFFVEPLEYFLAVCVHMGVDGQLHPAVRIPACLARI